MSTAPNPVMQQFYDDLGDILAERGDAGFVTEGPAMLAEHLDERQNAFLEDVETEHAPRGEYTRAKVVGGEDDSHVIRFMEWPPGYVIPPHRHNGRPCFEGLVDGELVVTDMQMHETSSTDDSGEALYAAQNRGSYILEPGETGVIDPQEGEVHRVYAPERARSIHVYPIDAAECIGYEPADGAGEDLYREVRFCLDE